MSNSSHADMAVQPKPLFVLGDHVQRQARLEGTWLNVFDVTVPAGGGTPLHSHASPEVFRILEGSLLVQQMTDAGLVETDAQAGDIISIPGDVPHGYSNVSTEPTVFSAIIDKDMAAYFEVADIGPVAESEPAADAKRFAVAANAHGIQILAA
jgi:quercetin dioxygenase-like cupin family protein